MILSHTVCLRLIMSMYREIIYHSVPLSMMTNIPSAANRLTNRIRLIQAKKTATAHTATASPVKIKSIIIESISIKIKSNAIILYILELHHIEWNIKTINSN